MSNNPFLKSKESNKQKESNNRFASLQEDDTSSNFKNSSQKSNKKIEYEQTQNVFTQSSFKSERPERRDNSYNRSFKDQNKKREPSPPPIDSNDLNLFPDLAPIKQITSSNNNNIEQSSKFKDILTHVVKDDTPKQNPVPDGWVKIVMVNRDIVYEYGPPTPWMIRQQKQEELQKQREEDPNYIMNCAINAMKKNWERYEREYDEIHGEGAYEAKFRLPPVYGPEYDESESEEEYSDEDDIY